MSWQIADKLKLTAISGKLKFPAFTLAEVLITLGIIGVVASMTIPNLIANTNGAKFRSQFKKSISTLSQAARMSVAQYDFDYAAVSPTCSDDPSSDHPEETMTMCSIFNGTLAGATYLGNVTTLKDKNGNYPYQRMHSMLGLRGNNFIAYQLADGTIFAFNNDSYSNDNKGCTFPVGSVLTAGYSYHTAMSNCTGFIDVNGLTLPNKPAYCASTGRYGETTPTAGNWDCAQSTGRCAESCIVPNKAGYMNDIFPVVFHDSGVEPFNNAAEYVLNTAK